MVDYTRKEIRTRVQDNIRDPNDTEVLEAVKNRSISDIHRDFVERSGCNRNVVIFSIADAASDGVLEYDRNGHTPTLTRVDVEGYNFYRLSGCDFVDRISRWITTVDGYEIRLQPADDGMVARHGLLSGDADYPGFYQMNGPDMFRLLKNLSTTAYPIKLRIAYRESVQDLIEDEDMPTDTSSPVSGGAVLNDLTVNVPATVDAYYDVEIDGGDPADPNTFKWSKDGGAETAGVVVTGAAQLLSDGLYVLFGATTGHTTGDKWTIYQNDHRLPYIPLHFRDALVDGATAEILDTADDVRADKYRALYERKVGRCRAEVHRDTTDKPVQLRPTYRGAGG